MRTGLFCLCCGFVFLLFGLLGYLLAGGSASFAVGHVLAAGVLFGGGAIFCGYSGVQQLLQASRKPFRTFVRRALLSGALLALLVGVNVLAARLSWSVDTTEENVFSLTDESKAVLQKLETPVQLYMVRADRPQDAQRQTELIRRYAAAAPEFVKAYLIDPIRDPHRASDLGLQPGDEAVLVFADHVPIRLQQSSEESVTTAIARHVSGGQREILFLTGHGEPILDSAAPEGLVKLKELLASEQLAARPVLLAEETEIPGPESVIAIVAPQEPLPAAERSALSSFVAGGGSLIFFAEPNLDPTYSEFLKQYGIIAESAVVMDKTQRLFDAPAIGWQITTRAYDDHEIVHGMTDSDLSVFLLGLPLTSNGALARRYDVKGIVSSPGSAWGERNLASLFGETPLAVYEPGVDLRGPLYLGMSAVLRHANALTSRIVVFGDASWIQNQNLSVYANDKLAARSFLWSAGEGTEIVARPRSFRKSVFLLSTSVFQQLLLASFLIPELIFLAGLIIWWRRTRGIGVNV